MPTNAQTDPLADALRIFARRGREIRATLLCAGGSCAATGGGCKPRASVKADAPKVDRASEDVDNKVIFRPGERESVL